MSTATEILQRYTAASNDIKTAITELGGVVGSGDGFEDFADDIGTITGGGIDVQTYEWQQTPEAVQNYIEYIHANPYDSSDYSYSYITNYVVPNCERPIGKAIVTEAGVLDIAGYKQTVTAGSHTIYNIIPNSNTPYTLISNKNIRQVGTLNPNSALRQIMPSSAENAVNNIRDIGGWQCDGGTIKYGKLYRGGEVYAESDLEILLDQLGIRSELELQGTAGAEEHRLSDTVDYCCPINGENWANYTLVNKEQMREAMRFVFDSVKKGKPLYFHCHIGADRTGTIACIIESLLGVSSSDIDCDFEITSFYIKSYGRHRTDQNWKNLQTQINALSGSTRQMKMANYFASLGFTAAEINEFRSLMIDGAPSTLTPTVSSYAVTNNLIHVTNDNTSVTVTEYQPYEANIEPDEGYIISSVQILMDGIDITDQVWNGERVPFGTLDITENGNYEVDWIHKVSVDVPSVTPAGDLTISSNGTYDVSSYARAIVDVASGAQNCTAIEFTTPSDSGHHAFDITVPNISNYNHFAFFLMDTYESGSVSVAVYEIGGAVYSSRNNNGTMQIIAGGSFTINGNQVHVSSYYAANFLTGKKHILLCW